MSPLVLDLYCGAGLVADGLLLAGCRIVGVDKAGKPIGKTKAKKSRET